MREEIEGRQEPRRLRREDERSSTTMMTHEAELRRDLDSGGAPRRRNVGQKAHDAPPLGSRREHAWMLRAGGSVRNGGKARRRSRLPPPAERRGGAYLQVR